MHEIAVAELGGIAEYQDQVATLMADGWDRTLAETVAGFEHWGAEAGITHDYVVAKYAEYQAAVKAGDAERMAAIEEEVNAWRAAADEKNRISEEVLSAAVSAYQRAKDAGISAYDETYQAAIESGAGQEQAARQAQAAQEDAIAQVLAAEGEKYSRIAAFEAALEAIKSGNADGAAEAARVAAKETTDAWGIAMDAVAEADQIASDAIADNAVATTDTGVLEVQRLQDEAEKEFAEMARAAAEESEAIQASINAIEGKSVSVNVQHHTIYSSSGSSGEGPSDGGERAAGGPVSGGRSYLIGERGPELFTPRSGGHVTANRDIIDYDRLAAAIAANPPVIAPDQVAAASLRESPAERAWRGWQ